HGEYQPLARKPRHAVSAKLCCWSRLSLLVQWLDALFADHLACVRRNVQALVSVPDARSTHFCFLLGIPKHGLLLTIGLHTQPDPHHSGRSQFRVAMKGAATTDNVDEISLHVPTLLMAETHFFVPVVFA